MSATESENGVAIEQIANINPAAAIRTVLEEKPDAPPKEIIALVWERYEISVNGRQVGGVRRSMQEPTEKAAKPTKATVDDDTRKAAIRELVEVSKVAEKFGGPARLGQLCKDLAEIVR